MLMLTMARVLSELLGASEPLFSISLQQLERATGHSSTDVRLTAELVGKVHLKMRELGLDPSDTTGQELYTALLNLVAKHDEFLVLRLGGQDPADVADLLPRLVAAVERLDIPKSAWVIKHSVAKRLLKSTPPRRVMKLLGYRSIDSMLKRESVSQIFAALRFVEAEEWLEAFIKKYQRLTCNDFETRPIDIIQLEADRWGPVASQYLREQHHNLVHLKELGVIAVLPLPIERLPGVTITVLPLLLHYIGEIRLYSAWFKLHQVRPDFGRVVAHTLLYDPTHHARMAGQHVHWRIIQRHYGRQDAQYHPDIFEPHLQPEDLRWRKAEDLLYRLEPALYFWYDLDFVGAAFPHRPVSFNLMDLAVSYVNRLPYRQQAIHHFQQALWNEIYLRYFGHKALEKQVLDQLETAMIAPDGLAPQTSGAGYEF